MSAKKSFVLRLDTRTYSALEAWAGDEFRSVNGQLEYVINKALKDSKRMKLKSNTQVKENDESNPNE